MTETTVSTTTLANMPRQCSWCGMIHGPRCPIVKAIEYHQGGTVKRVEFYSANDYPPQRFPHEVFNLRGT